MTRPRLAAATALGGLGTLAVVLAAPVAVAVWSLADPSTDVWSELWATRLPGMVVDTLALLALVVTGTLVLGTSLAWVVTAHEFRGRRLLGWLLVTPLAVPSYVLGFVWLDILEGPLGRREVRSLWVCALVMVFSLYPYVYLFARAAFRDQSGEALAAARALGCTRLGAAWRVTIPMARPSLAAGAALVAMEVLTDIGTVRLFNVSTVADGVMRTWFGLGDRDAAAELSVTLVAGAAALVVVERWLRGRARYTQDAARRTAPPPTLSRVATLAAIGGATAVLVVAVALPIWRLVGWAREARRAGVDQSVAGDLGHHVLNTLTIAAAATVVCLGLGIVVALAARRLGGRGRVLARLCSLGYAVPGPVVAIGVVVVLAALDRRGWAPTGMLLVGSFVGLVYALTVRFFAIAHNGVDAGLAAVPPSAVASARTLGARPWRVATRVELPASRAALLAAGALVAVDTVKELPITLLLRPFGRDTLAVWVWHATSESLWVQAAVPALAIVVVAMVPVALLLRALDRGAGVAS